MDRKQVYRELFMTIAADLADYPLLLESLEAQFQAALAHDAAGLEACACRISELCDRLERSRHARQAWVRDLLPVGAELSMSALLDALPPNLREQGAARWRRLCELVAACRERNLRNGQLLQQRQALLRRVLEGESDVYAAQ
ncbi:flagellar export chaperone FlgN [Chromobacterium phragmitis]|uniref:flagellar protein FlgN n=1 Tax=Chromobacterium amazonense TaxID=1382803 RepID=UPI0021B7B36F|nr:flagellar protein FlgN [Chromobacterium amazonense]MBM2884288.1 flagellar export chaperone FlgN [Chromobacterium amazonense]